ncbi:hypothetical protein [Helicobacter sp. T3_23-1056]
MQEIAGLKRLLQAVLVALCVLSVNAYNDEINNKQNALNNKSDALEKKLDALDKKDALNLRLLEVLEKKLDASLDKDDYDEETRELLIGKMFSLRFKGGAMIEKYYDLRRKSFDYISISLETKESNLKRWDNLKKFEDNLK